MFVTLAASGRRTSTSEQRLPSTHEVAWSLEEGRGHRRCQMTSDDPASPQSSPLQQIANEMVRLFKDQFGRGPRRARAHQAGPDTVVVSLEETLTPAERNLAAMGEEERLRETRMFFQYASVKEFCEPIERITGRKVRAFISGLDVAADGLAVELFVLHPEGYDGPSRSELG